MTERDSLQIRVCHTPEEILRVMEESPCYPQILAAGLGSFPMSGKMLFLLKKANPLPQEYHYIERRSSFAFFTVYENRMNLLTFGKASWYMKIRTIAYPCSLSCGGYLTNDLPMMLSYIKSLKGGTLVLNVPTGDKIKGMCCGETLPTCRLTLRPEHTSPEAYLDSLRSTYRRRIRLALKHCEDVEVREYDPKGNVRFAAEGKAEGEVAGNGAERTLPGTKDAEDTVPEKCPDLYDMYCKTYERSEYKLEKLERSFFERIEAVRLVFYREGKPKGFVLLKQASAELVFLFCGMDYPEQGANADLYYLMLYHIVVYGISHRCRTIDFGQTSENTKLKFGAVPEKRFFYAHHSNPVLNLVALAGKTVLEYHYRFPDYHVFKET